MRGIGTTSRLLVMKAKSALALVLFLFACHGKDEATTPTKDVDAAIPKVDPTLCDTTGKNVVTYDLNKDGKPDVWRLYKTEDEGGTKVEFMTCKQVDFDHDGRKDWVVAYNRKGTPLFEKADFDYDGKVDRKEEIPGAHPKVEMPTNMDTTATSGINDKAAPAPAPAPAPKK